MLPRFKTDVMKYMGHSDCIGYRHVPEHFDVSVRALSHLSISSADGVCWIVRGATSLSPCRRFLAVTAQTAIDIHNLDTRITGKPITTKAGLQSPVQFVHDGEVIAGGWSLGKVRLWIRQDGTRLQTLDHSGQRPYPLSDLIFTFFIFQRRNLLWQSQ